MRGVSPSREECLSLIREESVQSHWRATFQQVVIATIEGVEIVFDQQQSFRQGCRSVDETMMARCATINATLLVGRNPAGVDTMPLVKTMIAESLGANDFIPGLNCECDEGWTNPNAMFEAVAVTALHD